ncbi:type III restriction enzyme, res subunit [Porphyromonas gingivalis F0569]|uniref:DEAD/DEAH box helicase family protein n=1 Tax=Porphyromonas gingivalis TaxID=837 RepID=UPI0003AD2383|nr:DEAD/DEAH box helicase family protein [Porphyromonas gingivalis]ERJ64416.1 type III restriction enzyme, res subunit [Porphyromonas gingivalis F0569]OWR78472.1 type III restriction endonuclease subunit R [Porphyromonas gingivalis SJD11]
MSKKDKNETLRQVKSRLSMREPLAQCLGVIADITDRLSLDKRPTDREEQTDFLADELAKAREVAPSIKSFGRNFPSLTCSIATGIGKTRLMAATIYYLHQVHGIKHFFILAPNLTLYNKLLRDFGDPGYDKYVFKGLAEYVTNPPVVITGENYLSVRPNMGDQQLFQYDEIEINIFNIAKFNSDNKTSKKGGVVSAPRMKRLSEYLGTSYYDYLASLPDLVVLMDEAHRYYADASRSAIDDLSPVLGIEMTATPLRDNKPVGNIIYEYNLAEALREGLYVKIPTIAKRADFRSEGLTPAEVERIKLEDGLSVHQHTMASLEIYARTYSKPHVKPFVLVACRDLEHARQTTEYLESDSFYSGRYKGKVLQIDSSTKGEDDLAQLFLTIEEEGNPIEIVVHVNMLGEGWDVRNLYTIIPLRAANAHTLIEQTIGRGLRLPFEGKRTGVEHIDKLTIIAHDNFQRIVDAANEEDSILHRCSYVELDAEDLDTDPVHIVTFEPKTNEPLAHYQAQVASAQTSQEREKAQTLCDATEAIQRVLSEVAIETQSASIEEIARNEAKLEVLVNKAKEAVAQTNSIFTPLVQEELSTAFVKETITRFKRNLIEIPRISILPREIRYELERFEVDFSKGQFDFTERKERIVRQNLVDSKQELIDVVESGRTQNIKSKLLMLLLDEPEIDYSEMREELVYALNQVLEYVHSYSADDQAAIRTLDQNSQLIASRLYEQIRKHFVQEVISYGEAKVLPFVKIEPVYLGERAGYPRKTLYEAIPSLHQIRRFIFHGFAKACHECYSFDSGTERNFAQILEQDGEVLTWLRPSAMQFNIHWGRDSRRYEPDFVVETTDCIYLVETKASKELSNEEVLAKAEAARQYCSLATDYTTQHGGKPWHYLLVSHLDIEPTFSFKYVCELSKSI